MMLSEAPTVPQTFFASVDSICTRVTAFAPAEVEYLAYLEHRRWMEERLRNGWTWGEKRDDARRTHPDLVPYDELGEASKALDRLAASSLLTILGEVGLGVYR